MPKSQVLSSEWKTERVRDDASGDSEDGELPCVIGDRTFQERGNPGRISPVGKEKVYGGTDLPKSQVLSSQWKTERVREDASGDSEDGEDDELPCVIGESEGFHVIPDIGLPI